MKKKPLTTEDQAECARLKKLWQAHRGDLTQEKLGGILGVSQGMVTQLLNGHTRIGSLTLLKISSILGFDPEEVRPGFFTDNPELRPPPDPKRVDRRAISLAQRIEALGDQGMDALESLLDALER